MNDFLNNYVLMVVAVTLKKKHKYGGFLPPEFQCCIARGFEYVQSE